MRLARTGLIFYDLPETPGAIFQRLSTLFFLVLLCAPSCLMCMTEWGFGLHNVYELIYNGFIGTIMRILQASVTLASLLPVCLNRRLPCILIA